jgi:hypothetical protein
MGNAFEHHYEWWCLGAEMGDADQRSNDEVT